MADVCKFRCGGLMSEFSIVRIGLTPWVSTPESCQWVPASLLLQVHTVALDLDQKHQHFSF